MTNKPDIKYRYSQVITLKYSFTEPELADVQEIKTDIKSHAETNFLYQKESNHFVIDLDINLNLTEIDFQLFELKNRHFFGIKSDISLIEEDNDGEFVNLPEQLLVTFTSIAYSTTRGIIKEKLAGTRLSDIMLPIIDPKKLAPIDKVRVITFETEGR